MPNLSRKFKKIKINKNVYKILNNNKHQEKIGNDTLFSVYLCRLHLKSFSDFIVVCNVTWLYFKDIIIIIMYFAWSVIGVVSPGWEF